MENGKSHTQFREKNLVLQLTQESQIKTKTDELELTIEKRGHFVYCLFCPKGIFLTSAF